MREKLAEEAAARRPRLIAAYVEALGGADRVGPILMEDIERTADLVLLAREMRAAVRLGTAKLSDMTTLEGAADRAVRRLNLPAPGPSKVSTRYGKAEPVPTIADYFANKAAAETDGHDG